MSGRRRGTALPGALVVPFALACGTDGGEASIPVVEQAPDAGERSDRWDYGGGRAIHSVRLGPEPAEPGAAVEISLRSEGLAGCQGRLGLLPPRVAARQQVWRGSGSVQPDDALAPDPRAAWHDLEFADGDNTQRIDLAAPFHPTTAVVVLETHCAGRLVPVRAGPRRERIAESGPVPGAWAVLGLIDVARRPTAVRARLLDTPPKLDGRLDDAPWQGPGHAMGDSLRGEPPQGYAAGLDSQVWVAWDDEALYVAADLADADVWTEFRDHDDPLYRQEAFELMVWSGTGRAAPPYVELQVAPSGARFDSRLEARRRGDEAWNGAWSAAVHVDGTLGDAEDRDRGWSVEVALPWTSLCEVTDLPCHPQAGRTLRMNLFRLDKPDRERQVGLALSPTLQPDFHAPENVAVITLEGS